MDSPQLLHLALLLLALAAPHPNIATPIVSPVEGTEDSSTVVKVYRCEQCNSCICTPKAIDFEKYRMVADSQNKSSSDVLIKLMTNKTHTTVCFEEENSCLNETYGIYWERDGKPGLACGILSSGGNGRGDISTEQKTVCCEAETDTKKYNPELKCFYPQKSHPKLNISPDAIRSEGVSGNPEFLTSKKNSTGILFAFLFVGVCAGWGTMYYCLRLRRRGQAFRACRQASEGDVIPLAREPSTRKETPLTAASSSSLRMHSNQLNTD